MSARLPMLAIAALLAAAPATAQLPGIGGGVLFQRFTFDDVEAAQVESISLTVLPFSARASLGSRVTLGVDGAWADGRLDEPDGEQSTISGLTDTQVVLSFLGRGGATTLSAIALLPTGNETQDLSQSRVAGAVASELLPFALSNWGTGGGGGISASTAHVLGGLGVGVSVSYLVRREFAPLADEEFAYRPGNVLRVVAAVDGTIGSSSKGTLRFTLHRHEDDALEEANLFRAGNRMEVMGSLGFPVGGRSTGLVYALFHRRERGTFLSEDGSLASQDLVSAGGAIRSRVGNVVLQPRVEARVFRREDGVEQGYNLGAGLDAEIPMGATTWVPSVRAHLGNLEVRQDTETAFVGLELGMALRFGGTR